jgi:hypothetical protein
MLLNCLASRTKEIGTKYSSKWIKRPFLGGGCGFLGRDLRGFDDQHSVYDAIHQKAR